MRLGKRCSLCGGKLDSSLRCTECGLDNTKNDDMYKYLLNQNNCKDRPLTHVHEEARKDYDYSKYVEKAKSVINTSKTTSKHRKKKSRAAGLIVTIIMLMTTIIPAIFTILGNLSMGFREEVIPEYFYTEPEDFYEYEYWLSPGLHEAGVHIPSGWCEIVLEGGEYVTLVVYEFDGESFWEKDYCSLNSGESYSFELEEGDFLSVEMVDDLLYSSVWLYTDSADFTKSVYVDVGEVYAISGQMVVGSDFPAGVYDIVYAPEDEEDYGNIDLWIKNPNQDDYMWMPSMYFESGMDGYDYSENNIYGYYTNIPLTPGTLIIVEEGLEGIYLAPTYEIGQEMYDITWGAGATE